ncbi:MULTISPECIES: hypothetical protein [unclassified Neochlamydia]|uniref:hypothetical protein n=1 Tax=unclassified Neochlamydia TaxID=2643326 RepID=UPI001409B5D6|nr:MULTISPECIES: hypothetical protein [unclassified Neochlamydia]MBS4167356.1 Uncharacterized protein [Neochlamydia sp. AcF65]MBS4171422.1 Uncharacterized protein [Neochlamydia sp. AcF95]NGY95212.1 hypothetical protein [Neochlamydia sp. AcF84]
MAITSSVTSSCILPLKICAQKTGHASQVFSRICKICSYLGARVKGIALEIFYYFQEFYKDLKDDLSIWWFEKEDPIDTEARLECERLRPEIEELKRKTLLLDTFINERPELKAKCLEYYHKYKHLLIKNIRGCGRTDFDPDNPVDQLNILAVEKLDLEFEVNQRINFITRFKEVYTLFEKHVIEAEKAAKGAGNVFPLLLTQALENKED